MQENALHSLCKPKTFIWGLEHPWISVSVKGPGTNLPWTIMDSCTVQPTNPHAGSVTSESPPVPCHNLISPLRPKTTPVSTAFFFFNHKLTSCVCKRLLFGFPSVLVFLRTDNFHALSLGNPSLRQKNGLHNMPYSPCLHSHLHALIPVWIKPPVWLAVFGVWFMVSDCKELIWKELSWTELTRRILDGK